jgi:hypothetical protein
MAAMWSEMYIICIDIIQLRPTTFSWIPRTLKWDAQTHVKNKKVYTNLLQYWHMHVEYKCTQYTVSWNLNAMFFEYYRYAVLYFPGSDILLLEDMCFSF